MLLLLFSSLLFVGGHSGRAQLEFTLRTSGDCTVGVPIVTLWIEFVKESVNYLMTFNSKLLLFIIIITNMYFIGTVVNNEKRHTVWFNYSAQERFYFHFIDCNHSSISCIVSISNAKILTTESSVKVTFCRKNLTQLSSHQFESTASDGMLVTNICESIEPLCLNGTQCCSPTPTSTSISSSFKFLSLLPISYSSSSLKLFSYSTFTLLSHFPIPSSTLLLHSPIPSLLPTASPVMECYPQTDVTERGRFEWPITLAGNVAIIACPNGPNGVNASRGCSNFSNWESPNVTLCATTSVTNGFVEISKVCYCWQTSKLKW